MGKPPRPSEEPGEAGSRSSFQGAGGLLEGFEFEDPCVDEPRLGFKPLDAAEP